MKNLIILFALVFLALIFFGSKAYKSYDKDSKVLTWEEIEVDEESNNKNKNFEVLEVSNEKKKQMEESLGYEISEIKYIRLIDKEAYTKEDVYNKEGYTIENISEVKNVMEFDGRDVYDLIYKNTKYKKSGIKIGNKILKNDYMVDLPIDAKIISNALGFDVKKTYTLDLNLDLKAEGKSFTKVSLYPEINNCDFEINKDGKKVSKGTAKKVVGAYLIIRKEKINES